MGKGKKRNVNDWAAPVAASVMDEVDEVISSDVEVEEVTEVGIKMIPVVKEPSPYVSVCRVKRGTSIVVGRRILTGGAEITDKDFPNGAAALAELVKRGLVDVE